MPAVLQKGQRNQSMECAKMVASFFVVLIHVTFPGTLNRYVNVLALFAVPMFFAISGYFCYGADSHRIARRMGHIIRLNILIDMIHLLWLVIATELEGGSTAVVLIRAIPDLDELLLLLTVQHNNYLAHLWYMASLVICYGVIWIYVRFYGTEKVCYRSLYLMGLMLGAAYLPLATLLPAAGMEMPYLAYRNAWLFGLPVFILGIFLHEYYDRIMENFHLTDGKLVLGIAIGVAMCLLHSKYASGEPLGLYIEVPALMLLLISHPTVPVRGSLGKALIGRFAVLSTAVYLLHITLFGVYEQLLRSGFGSLLGAKEPWLRPLLVYLLSLLGAIVWERTDWLLKRKKAILA